MPRPCQEAMRKVRGDFGAELGEFNGEDDHVHLLAGYPPKVAVPALVNSLKRVRPGGCDRSSPPGEPAHHARALLVTVLLRCILRRCPARHHPAGHRTAKAPGYPTSDPARRTRLSPGNLPWPRSRWQFFLGGSAHAPSSPRLITILPSVSSRSIAFLGSVTVTVTLFRVLPVQLAVVLAAFPHLLAVLVDLQPVLELLGPALFLGSRVPFFLFACAAIPARFPARNRAGGAARRGQPCGASSRFGWRM